MLCYAGRVTNSARPIRTMQSPSVTWYAGAMAKCDCYLVTTYGKVFEGGGGEGDRFVVMWVSCDS